MRTALTPYSQKAKQQKPIQLLQLFLKLVKNKVLLFFHFPDLRNLVKCLESVSMLFLTKHESYLSVLFCFN